MRCIADFHIHSRYSRACSKDLTLPNLAAWAGRKGIQIMGTGDFTHPGWLGSIKEELILAKPGLYRLRSQKSEISPREPYFLLTAEISSIYKQGDKVRRVHNLLFAPSVEAVERLVKLLEHRGVNLKADGRPIMGLACDELVKICKDADAEIAVIPAHAWTPHFGVFGSLSGFDSIEEAFKDQAQHIFAIETGLSSDPAMNWQVAQTQHLSLISNSDAHSLRKLGREANVFEIPENELSYDKVISTIRNKNPDTFLETIEFFPEEGKYHLDGHRDCEFSCAPARTRELGGICPVCGKKLLVGVMSRIDALASHPIGYKAPGAVPFRSIIPLEEIIAQTLGVGTASKKVEAMFMDLTNRTAEFELLLDTSSEDLQLLAGPVLADAILRVRSGAVLITPGYDGVFGKISMYKPGEHPTERLKRNQQALF